MSVLIVVNRPRPCLTCEQVVDKGHRAYWEPDIGIWHDGCPPPANLEQYRTERERRKALLHG